MYKKKEELLINLNVELTDTKGLELKSSGFKPFLPDFCRVKFNDVYTKYNRLTITGIAGSFARVEVNRPNSTTLAVIAKCDCGNVSVYPFGLIKKGNTKSCGCLALEAKSKTGKANITHGVNVGLKEKIEFRKDLKIRLEIEFGKKGINERLKNHLNEFFPEMITVYPKKNYKEYNPVLTEAIERKQKDVLKDKKTDYEVLYNRYKQSANRRHLEFSISLEDYSSLIDMPCNYCGEKPRKYNGIDRIYNKIGYTKTNSVSCCSDCNFLKGRFSEENFLKICNKIVNYQNTVQPGAGIMTPA